MALAKNKSTAPIHLRLAATMASAIKAWSAKQENGLKDFVKVRYGNHGPFFYDLLAEKH